MYYFSISKDEGTSFSYEVAGPNFHCEVHRKREGLYTHILSLPNPRLQSQRWPEVLEKCIIDTTAAVPTIDKRGKQCVRNSVVFRTDL